MRGRWHGLERSESDGRPSPGPRRRSGPRRQPIRAGALGAIGLVAGAAILSGLLTTAGDAQPPGETRPVEVSGAPLPQLGPEPDPGVGRPMPELRGTAFDGQPVRIIRDGKPKVVVFLAHWCPHCQREVPRLAAWLRGGRGPLGVDVYAVASATKREAPNYPPSAWLKREGWPAPVLVDDEKGAAAMAVGLSGYPFFVLVDRAGTVVHRHSGETSIPELERLIARVRGA